MSHQIHIYELEALQVLNAQTKSLTRKGALLYTEGGYSDIHPWPELGDPDLETVLEHRGKLFTRAEELARLDGSARAQGIQLESDVLASHRLVRDLQMPLKGFADDAIFKLKVSDQREALKLFVMRLKSTQKLRLDFNASLTPDKFNLFMEETGDWLIPQLDFIEDPCPYDRETYNLYKDLIAFDRIAIPEDFEAAVKVVKPVRENIEKQKAFIQKRIKRIVFTHNMDHPLGQRTARVCASQFYQKYPEFKDVGGLESFDGYHLRESLIGEEQETGFGFDRYLKGLEWQPLSIG